MRKLISLLMVLVLCISLSSCANQNAGNLPVPSYDGNDTNDSDSVDLLIDSSDEFLTKLKKEAVEQYEQEDYTPLSEPARVKILWLGFRNVTYGNLTFRMTSFDEEYLKSVVLNFEKSVERITNNNLDIEIDLFFVDESKELTKDDFLYLSQQSVQEYIDLHSDEDYLSVMTTVQSAGEENRIRNEKYPEYKTEYVILGLMTGDCLQSGIGYSTFNLGIPFEGTYPLRDPTIPSLYATAVAVHEWMHQLESIGSLLDVEYPSTHAYMGPEEFPGYRKIEADVNNYDFFEFYEMVLQGKLPYDNGHKIKYVGMYPKMWEFLTKYNSNTSAGIFTISTEDGKYYLAGNADTGELTITKDVYLWTVRKDGDGYYVILSEEDPEYRFDLNNDWDSEGNIVGIHTYTGYENAQRWDIKRNSNGTYSIQTAYKTGLFITVNSPGEKAVIKPLSDDNPHQQWVFTQTGL